MTRLRFALALGLAALQTACIASSVLDEDRRAVAPDPAELDWQPLRPDGLRGLYESIAIRGAAADSLWKIYYLFEDTGRYTAAALVAADAGLQFQVLDGTWTLTDAGLSLDGAAPVQTFGATDHVRIQAPTGEVVLRQSRSN